MNPTTQAADLDVTIDLGGVYLRKADFTDASGATVARDFAIASVARELFEARAGRLAQRKIVLTFTGDPARRLSLIPTNLRILADAWGKLAAAWIGRTLTVYVDPTVRNPNGAVVGGLRVRISQLPSVMKAADTTILEERIRQLEAQLRPATAPATPADDDDIAFAFGANTGT